MTRGLRIDGPSRYERQRVCGAGRGVLWSAVPALVGEHSGEPIVHSGWSHGRAVTASATSCPTRLG